MSDQLSPHFSIKEMVKSQTADDVGIDNTPTDDDVHRAKELSIHILEYIRDYFGVGFTPSSWFRCEQLERELTKNSFKTWCGKKKLDCNEQSWQLYFNRKSHPKGEAVDIEIKGISNDELFNWIKDNLVFDQLIREFAKTDDPHSGWVHVSWRGQQNRNESFIIN